MLICNIDNCSTKSKARELCMKHYMRLRTHGDPTTVLARQNAHGMATTPEYKAWSAMKARCYREEHKDYHRYGGRGIGVCDEWRESFLAFFDDMGNRPSVNHSLDRADPDGGYSKENCRWATRQQQVLNRRKQKPGKSGYYGVAKADGCSKWQAKINCLGAYYLGNYDAPEEAAWMYDQWAIALHGELATLNFEYTHG